MFGIILFAAGLVSFFWTDLGFGFWPPIELMVLGVVLACLRDPKKGSRNKTKTTGEKDGGGSLTIWLALSGIFLTACATELRCSEKFGASYNSDSVRTEVSFISRDTIIYIPADADTLFIDNPCDSLGKLIPGYFKTNDTGRSVAYVEIKPEGIEVICLCEAENRIITKLQTEIRALQSKKSDTKIVYKERASFWQLIGICVVVFLIGVVMGRISKNGYIF